ncbi:hypothetical protein M0811_14156 [Anaeramoeba ignava]|uniref:Fibronectin type-III domain-containing protein n=1 Tax=Anaeramoeba ignava TaxID=1746090 RepID=A0A9Q0RHG4_ANAIG|nr:hypothetical protein M0811_14156 [Anaeramoeba ignava]
MNLKKKLFIFFILLILFNEVITTKDKIAPKERKKEKQKEKEKEEDELIWNEIEQILSNDGSTRDLFSYSISISENRKYLVVGAPFASANGKADQGKVYVFENNGTNWIQTQILLPSDGDNDQYFGSSSSISRDGTFIVVGSPSATVSGYPSEGKAYIFENNAGNWIQTQMLFANDSESYEYFGSSIAISQNQTYLFIGAPFATVNGRTSQGKVYVFGNNAGNWVQTQILFTTDTGFYYQFGTSISISENENYLVIGAPGAAVNETSHQGKAYVFENNAGNWVQTQSLIASDGGLYYQFGTSISISENENDLFIGAPFATVNGSSSQGKVHVFRKNAGNWVESQPLIASDGGLYYHFGSSISVSQNDTFLVVGAPGANIGANNSQGKAYVFENNGTDWVQTQIIAESDGNPSDRFGFSVCALLNDIFVGATFASVGGNSSQGKIYVFAKFSAPSQVNLLNCSSLFSSFNCYWNQIPNDSSHIEYQIIYNSSWEVIKSPNLNQGTYYQLFNSSIYPTIIGNADYSIQIKACDKTKTPKVCGKSSNAWNLQTRIDSVTDFYLKALSENSIQVSWNYPNVPIIDSVPKLSHYVVSYKKQSSYQTSNISVLNSSTSYQITNLDTETLYSISVWGCRSEGCSGEDQGKITSGSISTLFGKVLNLQCSNLKDYHVSCSWNPPTIGTPSYYNLTYRATTQNDFNTINTNMLSQEFTVKFLNQEYQIDVSACDSFLQCGTVSSVKITTLNSNQSSQSSSKSTKIALGVVFSIIGVALIALGIFWFQRKKNRITKYEKLELEKGEIKANQN